MKTLILTLFLIFSLTSISYSQEIKNIKINSKTFGAEREIMIYTPRLYDESPDKRYEVVYVFDAQARQYFDLVHSTLTFLNSSVPMIVVGVISPVRNEDFLPPYKHEETAKIMRGKKGSSPLFLKFIRDEVFTYVEQNYRTLPTRLAVGHSNGGVFISYCLLEDPDMFDGYLAISPHLRYDKLQMVDKFNDFDPSNLEDQVFFYMCKGNESTPGWEESITKTRAFFERENYKQNIHFEYEYFPNLDHTTVIPRAVINGFNSWFNYRYWEIDNLKNYYTSLEKEANYQLSEQDLLGLIYHRYWAKDYQLAKSIFDWGLERYPSSEMIKSVSERLESHATTAKKKDVIFPERCLGVWEGTMKIYRYNDLQDSVKVRFTAAKTDVDSIYTWKTEYLSPTRPLVKDYKLVVDDLSKGRYILDEGDDVHLIEYNVDNRLYSLFKVNNLYLTSSTELVDGKLIFEVTSGKEENEIEGIKNYSYTNVQRVVLSKTDK